MVLWSPPWLGWPLWNIYVTNDHGYVPFVASIFQFFPHSWCITGCVARVTRMVSLVEQELLTFMSTWVHPRFLVGFQLLDRSFLCSVLEMVFVLFSFGQCVVCPLICGFWLILWCLQILLTIITKQFTLMCYYLLLVLLILWLVFIFVCELLFFCI